MEEPRARRWIAWGMLAVVAVSLACWVALGERLPREIRIATARPGGEYQLFARALAERIEQRTGRRVVLRATEGSVENHALLLAGDADLAVLQSTAVPLDGVAVLAPLYPEAVHVVVRAASDVHGLEQLAGRAVSLGPPGSGMRSSATTVLGHYGIGPDDVERSEAYFLELLEDPTLEAAVVTTGFGNPDLHRLLAGSDLRLLPIRDAEAIAVLHPLFRPLDTPRGLFGADPPQPPQALRTLATTSILAARADVGEALADAVLASLYEPDLRLEIPLLVPRHEAVERAPVPLHAFARGFLDPYEGLSTFASFVEAISGLKELLFGLAALVYLAWDGYRRSAQRRERALLQAQKDRLDAFLERTVAVERAQMDCADAETLERHLAEVTRIKLEALEELTHEDLRGDRMFLIFLIQCGNLSRKIEERIGSRRAGRSTPEPA